MEHLGDICAQKTSAALERATAFKRGGGYTRVSLDSHEPKGASPVSLVLSRRALAPVSLAPFPQS